ncbi:putative malate/L-lactate dehydrogenase [Viridothelium virens]|uniref:Putative malate/L-lactate dehydrogenase n=1 Tax=Viridothelium virens TaxID=1048519 RepID=A0A6A6HG74_VIRVR|nr:putative malate/L-lactate dehydrogenase [Viridothelium virens]
MATEPPPTTNISPTQAHAFATSILTHSGVPADRAHTIADCLVLADLRGVDTHGLNRLPGYIARIQHGVLAPNPPLPLTQKTPVMALLDANHTFGFVAGALAIDHGVRMAETFGVGIVGVRNSGHYGMAASYLLRAMEKGYAAFAFTNASRAMPAWGAREPLLGTSPFAVGLPGGEKGGFVLDMSPSVVARGKIRKAARRGERIPEGWALDAEGRDTNDPVEALKGVVLPIGGPKGSGLAMMMDIFGGLLTGSSFGGDVNDQYKTLDKRQGVGHWFMVFRPEVFLDSKEEYLERMDTLLERVRSSEKAAGVTQIFTPGEIEDAKMKVQREGGIPFTGNEIESLHELAKTVGSDARLLN